MRLLEPQVRPAAGSGPSVRPRHVMRPRVARGVYLAGVGPLAVAYYAVPGSRPFAVALLGGLTVAAIGVGVTSLRPPRFLGWTFLAVAVALTSAMSAAFAVIGHLGPAAKTYPAPNEVLHLITTPVLTAALIMLGRPAMRSRDIGMLLDIAGISLTNALIVWIALLRPATIDEHLGTTARVVTFANFIGAMVAFTAGARVFLNWHRVAALRWLGFGVLAFFAGDGMYAAQLLHGSVSPGGPADAGFQTFVVCCGVAALSPSMATVWSDRRGRGHGGAAGVVALTMCVLVIPAALLFEARLGPVTTGNAFAGAFAGLGVIVVIRLALSVNDHRRRAARGEAIRVAARELVNATTEDEVMAGVNTALRSMVPGAVPVGAVLASAPTERSLTSTGSARSGAGLLTIPLRSDPADHMPGGERNGARVMRFRAPAADLMELTPLLEAITDHAASALERIALATRIRAVEHERPFRALVLTSRDVTLISRDGRIEYATPPAVDLFGRDVRGSRIDELVELHGGRRDATDPATAVDWLEGRLRRPDGSTLILLVSERDLTDDPHVAGVVTTMRDITAERARHLDLEYRASHDPLTGLANRDSFHLQLQATRPEGQESVAQAVLFVDLDDFKMVNDTYGHHIGDRVLEVVARRIESCLRSGDLAARLGGDEFAVLLSRVSDEDAARAVAQRITDALSEAWVVDGMTLRCRASVGLAYGPAVSMAQLREADVALYAAKAAGKGRWSQYRHGMTTPVADPRACRPDD